MPNYDYKCDSCESIKNLNFINLESAPDAISCDCKAEMKRQFPAPSFRVSDYVKNAEDNARRCGVAV